jgi:hypothetical protein
MGKRCEECPQTFEPEKSFHKLCPACARRRFRAEQGLCEHCGLKNKGWSDQYFILSCTCEPEVADDLECYGEYP